MAKRRDMFERRAALGLTEAADNTLKEVRSVKMATRGMREIFGADGETVALVDTLACELKVNGLTEPLTGFVDIVSKNSTDAATELREALLPALTRLVEDLCSAFVTAKAEKAERESKTLPINRPEPTQVVQPTTEASQDSQSPPADAQAGEPEKPAEQEAEAISQPAAKSTKTATSKTTRKKVTS